MTVSVSVCIPAYNEEDNIANLLFSLINQIGRNFEITQIVVVSSGSTDKTADISEDLSRKDSRICVIKQDKREGKVSAINEFLRVATSDIIVLESADTIPGKHTIEQLCLPLKNPKIGMVGAHPIPTNNENSFMGYVSHLEWALHHRIAMRSPKCGELVAFRKVFGKIPNTAVDEAWIEYAISSRNYHILYVPQAIVYNRGPETISDLVKQRRRIACGHLDLKSRTRFDVSSSSLFTVLPAILEVLPKKKTKELVFFVSAFVLEAYCRLLGYFDYYTKKERHTVWEVSKSTKRL
jgi:cellulose synthase/poly-beta-1,6-N-acetylglucosamine synthase-like glycosyltransferase